MMRYANGLPGGIPTDAFDAADANRALSLAEGVIQFVVDDFPKFEEAPDDRAQDSTGDLR
jgi:hypothetical protein